MAQPNEIQFGMQSWVGPENVLHGVWMLPREMAHLRVSGQLKNMINHGIFGVLGKKLEKNGWTDVNDL